MTNLSKTPQPADKLVDKREAAHRIKNVLTKIMMLAQLMAKDGISNEKRQGQSNEILGAVDEITQLVDRMK